MDRVMEGMLNNFGELPEDIKEKINTDLDNISNEEMTENLERLHTDRYFKMMDSKDTLAEDASILMLEKELKRRSVDENTPRDNDNVYEVNWKDTQGKIDGKQRFYALDEKEAILRAKHESRYGADYKTILIGKASEFKLVSKKLIDEDISYNIKAKIDALVDTIDLDHFQRSVKKIFSDLDEEGFDKEDISAYLLDKFNVSVKNIRKEFRGNVEERINLIGQICKNEGKVPDVTKDNQETVIKKLTEDEDNTKADKLKDEANKLYVEGSELRDKANKLHIEAAKIDDEGFKLRVKGDNIEGIKLSNKGDKLHAEAKKLRAEGDELCRKGIDLLSKSNKLKSQTKEGKVPDVTKDNQETVIKKLIEDEDNPKVIISTKDINGDTITAGDSVNVNGRVKKVVCAWDNGTIDVEMIGPGGPSSDTIDIVGHNVEKVEYTDESLVKNLLSGSGRLYEEEYTEDPDFDAEEEVVAEPADTESPEIETPEEAPETKKEEAPELKKEYVGKTEDTHYYIITDETDEGQAEDLQIVDQGGIKKYSAKDNNLDTSDVVGFIIKAIEEVDIAQIERGIFMKYILPKLTEEEKPELEEEPVETEEEEVEVEKPEETEEDVEESKVNEKIEDVSTDILKVMLKDGEALIKKVEDVHLGVSGIEGVKHIVKIVKIELDKREKGNKAEEGKVIKEDEGSSPRQHLLKKKTKLEKEMDDIKSHIEAVDSDLKALELKYKPKEGKVPDVTKDDQTTVIKKLTEAELKPFTEQDYEAFSGVEASEVEPALIGEVKVNNWPEDLTEQGNVATIIVDKNGLSIVGQDGQLQFETTYDLAQKIVSRLPDEIDFRLYHYMGWKAVNFEGIKECEKSDKKMRTKKVKAKEVKEDSSNLTYQNPGQYQVVYYDGTSEDIDALSMFDAKKKAESSGKKVSNVKLLKAEGKSHQVVIPNTEGKVPDVTKDSPETVIKKLLEMEVSDEKNTFDVYLVDDGTMDTVISVNGREFRFDNDFASFWRDEDGEMSDEGLKELTLDALSNLEEEEYQELLLTQSLAKETDEPKGEVPSDKSFEDELAANECEMDEKKTIPKCSKCKKNHWPFQKCGAGKKKVKKEEVKEGSGDDVHFSKEVYEIEYEKDGKKETMRVMALDLADAKKMVPGDPEAKVLNVKKVATEGKVPDVTKDNQETVIKKLTEDDKMEKNKIKEDKSLNTLRDLLHLND